MTTKFTYLLGSYCFLLAGAKTVTSTKDPTVIQMLGLMSGVFFFIGSLNSIVSVEKK